MTQIEQFTVISYETISEICELLPSYWNAFLFVVCLFLGLGF